jgi:hypothetical protein
MDSRESTSKQAIRKALDPAELRTLQAVQGALMAGVLLFGLVVVMLATRPLSVAAAAPTPPRTLMLLSLVHGLMALGTWSAAPVYWLNALSALAFLAFAVLSFPTRERVEGSLAERFGR